MWRSGPEEFYRALDTYERVSSMCTGLQHDLLATAKPFLIALCRARQGSAACGSTTGRSGRTG